MPARSYRVQKKSSGTRKKVPKVEAREEATGDVISSDIPTSPERRKDRSVSLSSGPDLADIPAYDPEHVAAEITVRGPQNESMADRERRWLRSISGNGIIIGGPVREKRRPSPQQPDRQGLPLFYSYDIEPRLLPLTKRFQAVNPEYFQEIFENRFIPENLAKLSNDFSKSCRSTKKQVKEGEVFRVVNIEADAAPEDIETFVDFFKCFSVYQDALVYIASLRQAEKERPLRAAITKYSGFLMGTFNPRHRNIEDLRKYHFRFHKQTAIMGIDDPAGWESFNEGTARA